MKKSIMENFIFHAVTISPKLCTSLLIYEETTDNESNRKRNNCDIFTPFAVFGQPLNYNLIWITNLISQ